MGQPIKYNTGTTTANCCIRKNNFDIGVVEAYQYGPTSGSGFYAGYPTGTIPVGGFISYQNKAAQGPSIYNIASVSEVQYFGTQLNIGTTLTTDIGAVIRAANNTSGLVMVNIDYPEIPQIDNNILTLDAGYAPSYCWRGAEWYNIKSNSVTQAATTGATTFVTGNSANNYSDSYLNMPAGPQNAMALAPAFSSALQEFTINIFLNLVNGNGYQANQNIIGQQYSNVPQYNPQTNCNFLIRGNGSNGFEGVIRLAGTDYVANFGAVSTGWNQFTFTFNAANEMRVYINGNQTGAAAGPTGTLISNGLQTIIGGTTNAVANNGNVQNYFDGQVNVVNIFNVALQEGEIQGLYSQYQTQRGF
jgi:hypothetical protein